MALSHKEFDVKDITIPSRVNFKKNQIPTGIIRKLDNLLIVIPIFLQFPILNLAILNFNSYSKIINFFISKWNPLD